MSAPASRPLREGMKVRAQNAFPSLDTDFLSITQHFDWLMPVGWYYKTFTHPAMWHAAEPIPESCWLGRSLFYRAAEYEHAWMHADTAVIGGGWAGIHAALAAAERGEEVVLIDDQPALGGHSDIANVREVPGDVDRTAPGGCQCQNTARHLLLRPLRRQPPRSSSTQSSLKRRRTSDSFAGATEVVATGAYETPLLFPNNDLAGVMLSTGVQRLLHLYGVPRETRSGGGRCECG